MMLSRHFSLAEFCVTQTGIANEPEPEHMIALHITAAGMETVRRLLGNKPINVTSAYRNRKVNLAVGGVAFGDHPLGWAVDFRHSSLSAKTCCKMIEASPLVFDQLILERHDSLVHISFNPRQRLQVLRQPGGPGTPFFSGLD